MRGSLVWFVAVFWVPPVFPGEPFLESTLVSLGFVVVWVLVNAFPMFLFDRCVLVVHEDPLKPDG